MRFSPCFAQKGTLWGCVLPSSPWLSWNGSTIQKKTNSCKTKKLQNNKNLTRPHCLPLLPSIGVCNLVFCCYLFFAFPRIFGRKSKTKKKKTQETKYAAQLSADAPPWGVQSCFFFLFFFGSPRIFVKHKKGKTSKQKINSTVTRPMCFSTGHTCRSCYCLLMPAIPVPQFKVAGCVDSACTCCHCGFSR